MFCPKCGTQNLDRASYCSICGNNLYPFKQEIEKKGITGKLGKLGVPGFRSGKTWKMVLASLGYFFICLITFSVLAAFYFGGNIPETNEETSTALQKIQHTSSYIYTQDDIKEIDVLARWIAKNDAESIFFERYTINEGTTKLVMFPPYANTVVSIERLIKKYDEYSLTDINTMLYYNNVYTTVSGFQTHGYYSNNDVSDIHAIIEYDGGKICRGKIDSVESTTATNDIKNSYYETSISATFPCYSDVYIKNVKFVYIAGSDKVTFNVEMNKYK